MYNMKKDVHGTQNKNSNPMGIGLGIDYVTWWEILKWIPPTSKLHVGTRFNNSWARVVKTSLLLCCRVLCFVYPSTTPEMVQYPAGSRPARQQPPWLEWHTRR